MKQEVNFYRGGTRPPKPPLGAEWMAWASLAVVLLLIVASSAQLVMNQRLRSRAAAAQQQAMDLESRLHELRNLHPEPKADPALTVEVERAQQMVDGLKRLLQTVNGGDLARHGGFTAYFEGLARRTRSDVWLTGIQFKDGGKDIELAGSALASESIPKLVQSLGLEPAFKAKTFSDFAIKRSEQQQGQVDFVLRTRMPEADNSGKH